MDILLALKQNNVQYIRGNTPAEIRINCLFCVERGFTQDFRHRLGINIQNGKTHCFNCGYASKNGLKWIAYKLKLGDIDNAFFGEVEKEKEFVAKLPDDFELIGGFGFWQKKALRYLRDRGLTDDQIMGKKVGISLLGKYRYRIIFPVYTKKKLTGFVTRSFIDQEPRYLNTPGLRGLYNFPNKPKGTELHITEGIFKCLKLERFFGRSLKRDIVAMLGHTMTEIQEDLIKQGSYREIVLWPDPDMVGTEGFIKIADTLSLRYGVTIPWPIPRKQVDEMEDYEIEKRYHGRRPFSENLVLSWKSKVMK